MRHRPLQFMEGPTWTPMTEYILVSPASPQQIRDAMSAYRERFIEARNDVRKIVEEALKARVATNVYKIYSRGEDRATEELKHPRKVRQKFNAHYPRGEKGSIFDVPDV